jgi:hypothetical protein
MILFETVNTYIRAFNRRYVMRIVPFEISTDRKQFRDLNKGIRNGELKEYDDNGDKILYYQSYLSPENSPQQEYPCGIVVGYVASAIRREGIMIKTTVRPLTIAQQKKFTPIFEKLLVGPINFFE